MSNEELIAGLKVAMLGTTDGDFIDGDSPIPAGEMFRLAAEYLEAQSAPLVADSREALIDVEKATSRHFGSALSRFVDSFDGDEAGQKAADRSLPLFLGNEVDVRVLVLPDDLDDLDEALDAADYRELLHTVEA